MQIRHDDGNLIQLLIKGLIRSKIVKFWLLPLPFNSFHATLLFFFIKKFALGTNRGNFMFPINILVVLQTNISSWSDDFWIIFFQPNDY